MPSCSRRLEFDAAHRVMRHESKCRNLHGHRYRIDLTASSDELDSLDRVIDFSVLKAIVGGWVDERWDHGVIVNPDDEAIIVLCRDKGWKLYEMPDGQNPTAETLAEHMLQVANRLLFEHPISITHVRIYETPNCWADAHA